MIKSIEINNFLSHKKTYLELSPGVNIIVGATDSGKSAIIRALKWLVWNRPMGDSYRSSWGGKTFVGIDVEDGDICNFVSRFKTDNENIYTFEGSQFKAFGSDVPEEIRQALNLNEINLQTQFESHFLLSKSPGEVASHFNKVAHLDRIDVGLFNIQRWLKRVQDDIKSLEQQTSDLHTELGEFDNIEEIEDKIHSLECIVLVQNELVDKVKKGMELVNSLLDVDIEINEIGDLPESEKVVTDLLGIFAESKVVQSQINEISDLIQDIEETDKLMKEIEDILPMEESIDKLLEIEKEEIQLESDFDGINDLMYNINYVEGKIESTKEDLKELEKEFHKHMGKGKICPLCGTILK